MPANQYPGARFADPASWLVDQERYAAFSADGAHHESRYFLTFLYLPPPEHEGRAERFLYERTDDDGDRGRAARPARVVRDRDRPRAGAAGRHPAGGGGARRCRDARLPARHHLDQAPAGRRAADPDASRCHPVRHAVARRHRAEARRPAPARADRARLPQCDDAGAARCAQRSGLRLPLDDALDRARQDRGDQDS